MSLYYQHNYHHTTTTTTTSTTTGADKNWKNKKLRTPLHIAIIGMSSSSSGGGGSGSGTSGGGGDSGSYVDSIKTLIQLGTLLSVQVSGV